MGLSVAIVEEADLDSQNRQVMRGKPIQMQLGEVLVMVDVVFAKAQITDPRLKYRKEAERYSMRGQISPAGRTLLNTLRGRLALTLEETQEIEDQILQPFRERLKHLEDYRSAFVAEVDRQYPLTQETQNVLKDLQQMLGLRDEDTQPIRDRIIPQLGSAPLKVEESITVKNTRSTEELRAFTNVLYLRIVGTSYAYEVPEKLDRISIGRQRRKSDSLANEGNDVVVRVPESDQKSLKISRKHLEISRENSQYLVLDKSGGRTKLNGNVLKENELHKLEVYDILQISDVLELEVLIQDKLETLKSDKAIEIYKSDTSKGVLVIEASIGDMVTFNETSIGDMATINSSPHSTKFKGKICI